MNQVVIIGLGKTGLSCVNYFMQRGIKPVVMDTRENPPGKDELPPACQLITGPLDQDILCQADLIISSPGIALSTPALQAAQSAGVEIIGDIELFAREAKAPVVAITGSNGVITSYSIHYTKLYDMKHFELETVLLPILMNLVQPLNLLLLWQHWNMVLQIGKKCSIPVHLRSAAMW